MSSKTKLIQLIEQSNDEELLEKVLNNMQLFHYQEHTPSILDTLKKTQEDIQNLQAQKDKFFSIISFIRFTKRSREVSIFPSGTKFT